MTQQNFNTSCTQQRTTVIILINYKLMLWLCCGGMPLNVFRNMHIVLGSIFLVASICMQAELYFGLQTSQVCRHAC